MNRNCYNPNMQQRCCNVIETDNCDMAAIENMDCRQLKQLVMELGFAIVDMTMYLDTHPTDCAALSYYHSITKMNKLVRKAYIEKCGPLNAKDVNCDEYFTWVNEPMPWDNCY